jgi:hypothetical protein
MLLPQSQVAVALRVHSNTRVAEKQLLDARRLSCAANTPRVIAFLCDD